MNLGVLSFTPGYRNYNMCLLQTNPHPVQYRKSSMQDSVSFGCRKIRIKELPQISGETLRADKVILPNSHYNTAINVSMAKDICAAAVQPMQNFRNLMRQYLRPLIATERNYDRPIEQVNFRIKKPNSLLQKFNSQDAYVQKQISRDRERYLHGNLSDGEVIDYLCYDKKSDALKGVSDIIGERIIMRDPSKFSVGLVLDAFGKAVNEGKLIVTEVENYYPVLRSLPNNFIKIMRRDFGIRINPKNIEDMMNPEFFSYASFNDLNKFSRICKKKNPDFKLKSKELPSGYQGIHIGVQLENGYKGEIQLFGRDVDLLKEMEDARYKALCGKSPNPNAPIARRFAQLTKPCNQSLKEADAEYTYWAYIAQRLKGVIRYKEPLNTKFLSAPPIVRAAGLDYNDLYVL